MVKVNRTVLHDSVPTIQEFETGGVVRTRYDLFKNEQGLWEWLGSTPHTVQAGTSPNSDVGNWVKVVDTDTLLKHLPYTTPEMWGDVSSDASDAIQAALDTGLDVHFTKGKEYKVSRNLNIKTNYQKILGNGCTLVWDGGSDSFINPNRNRGIFQVYGTRVGSVVPVTEDLKYGESTIKVPNHNLPDSGYIVIERTGDGVNATLNPYMRYLVSYKVKDSQTLNIGYKSDWNYSNTGLTVQLVNPIVGVVVSGFTLKDTQTVTVTGSINTQANQSEREKAISLVHMSYALSCSVSNLRATNFKFPIILGYILNDVHVFNVQGVKPDWVGGGEGYLVQFSNVLYCSAKRLYGTSTRHIIDVTTGAYSEFDTLVETNPIGTVGINTHGAYESNLNFNNVYAGRLGFGGAGAAYGYAVHSVSVTNSKITETIYNYTLSMTLRNCEVNSLYLQTNSLKCIDCSINKLVRLNKMTVHASYMWSDSVFGNSLVFDRTHLNLAGTTIIDTYSNVSISSTCTVSSTQPNILEFRNCEVVSSLGKFINVYLVYAGKVKEIKASHNQQFTSGTGTGLRIGTLNSGAVRIDLVNLCIDAGLTDVTPVSLAGAAGTQLDVLLSVHNVCILNATRLSRIVHDSSTFNVVAASVGTNMFDNYLSGSTDLYLNIPDSVKWKVGQVLPNGTSAAPRMWNGTNWVNLV